ncbi:MAG: hypothetical protein AWU57_480 [Marinobacter sp. T13-3]|nr:MAG: hypothetical protein AWU57_480 [Marinobacter sp. T13-3]
MTKIGVTPTFIIKGRTPDPHTTYVDLESRGTTMNVDRHARMNNAIMSLTALAGLLIIAYLVTDLAFAVANFISLSLAECVGIAGIALIGQGIEITAKRIYKRKRQARRTTQP